MRTLLLALLLAAPCRAADPLILALGDEDFDVREKASAQLRARGWSVAPLLRENRDHADPEISMRCRIIYEEAAIRMVDSFEPFPMIDSLWYDTEHKVYSTTLPGFARYVHFLDQCGGWTTFPYTNFQLATKLLVREWVDAGVPPWLVRLRLLHMHAIDACWVYDKKVRDLLDVPDEQYMAIAVTPWQKVLYRRWREELPPEPPAPEAP